VHLAVRVEDAALRGQAHQPVAAGRHHQRLAERTGRARVHVPARVHVHGVPVDVAHPERDLDHAIHDRRHGDPGQPRDGVQDPDLRGAPREQGDSDEE
jgi:hypothetical protein